MKKLWDLIKSKEEYFVVLEGILLGHVIYKDGILVDLKIKISIIQIPPLHSKNSMQSIFSKRSSFKKICSIIHKNH
jgi:hypothetical protein